MTNEEAKRRIEICRDFLANNYSDMGEPNFTAFNMAIKALEQNESAEEWYKLFVEKLDEQEPCEKSMNKAYGFGKNKGVGVYWNKQTDTVELPEAVFRYILSLVPTDKEIEE